MISSIIGLRRRPMHRLIDHGGQTLTYAELHDGVSAMAAALADAARKSCQAAACGSAM
jgi:acyl-CoA synthetase (AMP-forming)/AMP-acid ligase II